MIKFPYVLINRNEYELLVRDLDISNKFLRVSEDRNLSLQNELEQCRKDVASLRSAFLNACDAVQQLDAQRSSLLQKGKSKKTISENIKSGKSQKQGADVAGKSKKKKK